jgi:hypothetical protein
VNAELTAKGKHAPRERYQRYFEFGLDWESFAALDRIARRLSLSKAWLVREALAHWLSDFEEAERQGRKYRPPGKSAAKGKKSKGKEKAKG